MPCAGAKNHHHIALVEVRGNMLRDVIKEITGIFDQRFLAYIYSPVVAFCLA